MPHTTDQTARLRVLNDLDATLLVEAGAGTGKTALMAGRIALLLAAGVPPREIAAITFTEAAASELLARIANNIRDLCEARIPLELTIALPDGPSLHQIQNLRTAFGSLDELTCSTIHSFCQQLTRPYPVEASLDPGAAIMDEVQSMLANELLLEEWLREQLKDSKSDSPVTVLLVEEGEKGRRLLEQIIATQQERRDAGCPSSRLTQQLATDFHAAVASFRDGCRSAAQQGLTEEKTSTYAEEFTQLDDFYPQMIDESFSFRELWHLSAPPRIGAFKKDTYQFRKYQTKGAWEQAAKAANQPKTLAAQFNAALTTTYDHVNRTLTEMLDALGERVLSRLMRALEDFAKVYRKHKQSSALLDFDDLIYHARDLLRRSPEVRATLSKRYSHILVDEFQDTDQLQSEILFLLCGEGPQDATWSDMRLRRGQLTLVGDPKQSIYRFRRADIVCYERVRNAFLTQFPSSKVEITSNFRSQQDILTFVNDRFAAPLSEIGFAPLSCTVEGPPPIDPRVVRLDVVYQEETGMLARRRAEAAHVAGFCRYLLDGFRVRTRGGPDLEPCKPRHIALLAPSGTDLWIYEQALEEKGIPLSTQAGKGFFLRQEIHDLVAITRVLSNRRDTLALGALLRGPLVGLSEGELLDIVEALPRATKTGGYSTITVNMDASHIQHSVARETVAVLNSLAKRAYNTTPFDILSAAVEGLRIRPLLLQRHPRHPERTLANVDLFLDLARQYNARGLRVFARDMMRRWDDAERQIEGRTDAGVEAVQIITVHAAKGLEWPIVIPINMVTETRGPDGVLYDAGQNILRCHFGQIKPNSYLALKDAENEQQSKERKRMWYVCCTRARDMLAIPHHVNARGTGSWYNEIDLRLTELQGATFEPLPEYASVVEEIQNEQTLDVFERETATLCKSTRQIRWTTPSQTKEEKAQVLPNDDPLLASESLFEADLIAGSSGRGQILHKLMEEVLVGAVGEDFGALAQRAAVLIRDLGLKDVADPSQGLNSRELAETVLRTLSKELVKQYRPHLVPEWNLYSSSQTDTDNIDAVAGIADAVAFNAQNQPEFVFDWKSDVSPDVQTQAKHRVQLRQYLAMTGCQIGAVVYMTTDSVQEVRLNSSEL